MGSRKSRLALGCYWLCQCDLSEAFWGIPAEPFHFSLLAMAAFQRVGLVVALQRVERGHPKRGAQY